jgi:hypothetical protein
MNKTNKTSSVERFLKLPEAERERQLAEFDEEFAFERAKPLSAAARAAHLKPRARARRGRPRVGAGAQRVLVSIEKRLLKRADAKAKAEGTDRSKLIARGLEMVLAEG